MKNKNILASSVLGMSADRKGLKIAAEYKRYVLSLLRSLRVVYGGSVSLKFSPLEAFRSGTNFLRTDGRNLPISLHVGRDFVRFI